MPLISNLNVQDGGTLSGCYLTKASTYRPIGRYRRSKHWKSLCTSLQTDNHTDISSLKFFIGRMLFLTPNQQSQSDQGQSTEGKFHCSENKLIDNRMS